METVTCAECGRKMSNINNRHLASHQMTSDDYKKKYPHNPLMSEESRRKLVERAIKSNASRKGVKRTPEEISAIKDGIAKAPPRIAHNKGVPMKETTKENLSKVHKEAFASGKRKHHRLGETLSEEIKLKISKTLTGRTLDPAITQKAIATKIARGYDFGSSMRGKKHTDESKKKIALASSNRQQAQRGDLRGHMLEKITVSNLVLLNSITEDVFMLKCTKCEYVFSRTPQMFQPSKWHTEVCDQCFPISPVSKAENEVADYVKSLIPDITILRSDMETISLELDIFIPSLSIAIEYCGIWWHSEIAGKSRWYHRKKMELCEEKGIRLITIFEDEWINRRPIVESMLSNILTNTSVRIPARKCNLVDLNPKDGNIFIEQNHIQGRGRANIYYGLQYGGELVSVMSFSNNEISRNSVGWDINRFCSKLGTAVQGGAGKLFKHFLKEHEPDKVVSYADLRYGTGNVYGNIGFTLDGRSVPNYWYFRPGEMKRYHRYGLRKNSDDDQALTEWDNRQNQGWNRIWDCGHAKWVWTMTSASEN